MVQIRVVHPFVEFWLAQPFSFSFCFLTPKFVPVLMTEVMISLNRITSIRINKPAIRSLWSSGFNFFPNLLTLIERCMRDGAKTPCPNRCANSGGICPSVSPSAFSEC